ncbi:MAG: hypothetical protein AAF638_00590 [Pseudomonadota bacterium]
MLTGFISVFFAGYVASRAFRWPSLLMMGAALIFGGLLALTLGDIGVWTLLIWAPTSILINQLGYACGLVVDVIREERAEGLR